MSLLKIKISLDDSGVGVKLDSFTSKAAGVSFAFNQISQAVSQVASVVSVPIKKFSELQSSMANVETLGVPNIEALTAEVLSMGEQIAVPISDLSGGLFEVVSAGVDASNQIKVLELSARAAKAGVATTTEALKLASSVVKGYGLEWSQTEEILDRAFKTNELGQTNFRELAASMGTVVPLASALKVEVDELFGGFATLTGVTGNTAEVSTQYRAILQGLAVPTKELSDLIQEQTGLSVEQAVAQDGLAGILKIVAEETGGSAAKMSELFGSVEAISALLALTGSQYDTFIEKTKKMSDSQGAMAKAAKISSDTFKSQVQILENRWDAAMIRAVDVAFPFIQSLFDIALGASDSRGEVEKLTEELEDLNSQLKEVESLDKLIERYEELKGKAKLSKDEHVELKGIIEELSKLYPSAVTEINQYGDAVAISSGKVKELVKQQRALLRALQEKAKTEALDNLRNSIDFISSSDSKFKELQQNLKGANEQVEKFGAGEFGTLLASQNNAQQKLNEFRDELLSTNDNIDDNLIPLLKNFFNLGADENKLQRELGLTSDQVDFLVGRMKELNKEVEVTKTQASGAEATTGTKQAEPLIEPLKAKPVIFDENLASFVALSEAKVEANASAAQQMIEDEKRLNEEKKALVVDATRTAVSELSTLVTSAQGFNKELFAVGKAAAIGQAIVNTFSAANKALSTLPPPISFVVAAATTAVGLANVQRIVSTKFEKRLHGGFLGDEVRTLLDGDFGGGENRLIIANNREFIVNAQATSEHRGVLEAINSGQRFVPVNFQGGGAVGGSSGSFLNKKDFTEFKEDMVEAIRDININIQGALDGQEFLRENFDTFERDQEARTLL